MSEKNIRYEYIGPSSWGMFPNKHMVRRGIQTDHLEDALKNPNSKVSIHVMMAEGLMRTAATGLFGLFRQQIMTTGGYNLFYSVEAKLGVERGLLGRLFLGDYQHERGGAIIYPHQNMGIRSPKDYAQFVIGLAQDVLETHDQVSVFGYDVENNKITDRYMRRELENFSESANDFFGQLENCPSVTFTP